MCGKCLVHYDACSVRAIVTIGSEEPCNLIQQMLTEPGTAPGAEAPAWSEQLPALRDVESRGRGRGHLTKLWERARHAA